LKSNERLINDFRVPCGFDKSEFIIFHREFFSISVGNVWVGLMAEVQILTDISV